MNKKLFAALALFCTLVLVLSACGIKKRGEKEADKVSAEEQKSRDEQNGMDTKDGKDGKDGAKSDLSEAKDKDDKKPAENGVMKIAYDDIINKPLFTGLTKDHLAMLEKNGFVITEPNFDEYTHLKMHQIYEHMDYNEVSCFVTTDSVLNMWHVFYGESMKALEILEYYPALQKMSLSMENLALQEYQSLMLTSSFQPSEEVKRAYERIIAFFHVANRLMDETKSDRWLQNLKIQPGQDSLALADLEISLIEQGAYENSPLFERKMDYSQFKPRGHYTSALELREYFRAMMWYGLNGFDLGRDAVIGAILSDMLHRNPQAKELWQSIYELTAIYSGESDDILPLHFQKVVDALGQEDLAAYLSDAAGVEKLNKALQELPAPKMQAKLIDKDSDDTKLFKWMGQRFNVDGYILQELMKPFVRPIPTAFDVFAVMGNSTAEKYLRANYDTNQNWKEYDAIQERLKKEYRSGTLTAGDNFYNGWIRAIDKTLNYKPEGKQIPYFMTTEAYEYKKINAALGSYAELKHDNILYAKQAMAEMGGPEGNNTLHYVEPNAPLYRELADLSRKARKLLKSKNVNPEHIHPLDEIISLLDTFVVVSEKELAGEQVTKEELAEVKYFGGLVDYLSYFFKYSIKQKKEDLEIQQNHTSAIIADIATVLPNPPVSEGGFLEVATGVPYHIYALCHVNGISFLAKGAVFSAFEFMSEERLTDEQWRNVLGMSLAESGFYMEMDPSNYDKVRDMHMDYMHEIAVPGKCNITHDSTTEIHWQKPVK